ncbi:MAG: hypothetical protein ACI4F1_09225 [Bariatricus sp.]
MYSKIIIDGNSIYEIDENCLRQKEKSTGEKERFIKEELSKRQKIVRSVKK